MADPLALAVDAVAAYRLTRLVTEDTITEGPRRAIVTGAFRRAGLELPVASDAEPIVLAVEAWEASADQRTPKLATLVTCRWCTGVWIAAGVVAARRLAPRAWHVAAEGLAVSAAAALLARLED